MEYEIQSEIKKIAKINSTENKITLVYQVQIKVKLGQSELIETVERELEYDLFYDDIHSNHDYIRERAKETNEKANELIEKFKANMRYLELEGYQIETE